MEEQEPAPPAQQPVAVVQIVLTADGKVTARAQGCDRATMLRMVEQAKFDLERLMWEKERPQVILPPAPVNRINGRG